MKTTRATPFARRQTLRPVKTLLDAGLALPYKDAHASLDPLAGSVTIQFQHDHKIQCP
jgi:hypothetical protein